MDLSERFIPFRRPRRFVYLSDQTLRALAPRAGSREFAEYDFPAAGADATRGETWAAVRSRLGPGPIGLSLAPHFFIFNLFSFDRIPWKSSTRRSVVEWKLEKVFPDKIDAYHHRYYPLDGRTILSVLILRRWCDQVEEACRQAGLPLLYLGSTTIELMQRLFAGRRRPDFFLEYDRGGVALAFQRSGRLIYLRKLRTRSEADLEGELHKTLAFVRQEFAFAPKTCDLVSPGGFLDRARLAPALEAEAIALRQAPGHPYLPVH
jgi:hypothetical protein